MFGNNVFRKRPKRFFSAFTLAELIVVVSILAVLATIGFLGFSGYSSDARDSALKSNVRSVSLAISSESALSGNSPRYYVVHDSGAALTGALVYVDGDPVSLTGGDWNQTGTNYSAWNPDYAKLKLNPEKFKLSLSEGFPEAFAAYDSKYLSIGAVDYFSSSTGKKRAGGYFQVAAISPTTGAVSVSGNYPASVSGSVAGLVKSPTSTGALVDSEKSSNTRSCAAGVQTVNGHSYSVGAIPYGSSAQATSSPLTVTGGVLTYSQNFACSNDAASASGSESSGTVTCTATGYSLNGSACVPASCLAIKAAYPSSLDATYSIDPDGAGGSAAFDTYCDMTTDGGGWTLAGYGYMGSVATSASNQNFHSLKCGGGAFNPASRGTSSASIAALPLAKASTEIAFSISTGGASVTTGNMNAYSTAYKFAIPNPSQLTFDNHSYLGSAWSSTAGNCVAVTVSTLKGAAWSGTRYTKANSLGTSWTDSYPTGYGAVDNSSCIQDWSAGIFVTSIHSGHGNVSKNGTVVSECDVSQGSLTYSHRGYSTHSGVNVTGSAAIWFK